MFVIHKVDILPDLELLALFDAIHRERHLTRAAARSGKSQPAMSRALARMRAAFGDELFVRTPRGVVPTARADALAPEVRRLLDAATALVKDRAFSPVALDRTMTIGTSDFAEAQILSRLTTLVQAEAPRVNLRTMAIPPDPMDWLADGRMDLFIAPQGGVPPTAMVGHLFDDSFLCAVRADHPVVRRTVSLDRYTELSHIQIAPRGRPGGPVDDALAALGLSRRVAVRTPSFLAALVLLSHSDFIITGPRTILEQLSDTFRLRTFPLPFDVPGFRVVQAWHPRAQDDPAHQWLRSLIARVAGDLRHSRRR